MKRIFTQPGAPAARLDVSLPDQPDPPQQVEYMRWLSQMQSDLAESIGGITLQAARPVTLTLGTSTGSLLSGVGGRLVGWSIRESGGVNPLVIRFRNGCDNQQPIIGEAYAPAGQVAAQWMPPGVSFTEGLYLEVVTGAGLSGSLEGAVYLGAAD
jgi:hypothetical protein